LEDAAHQGTGEAQTNPADRTEPRWGEQRLLPAHTGAFEDGLELDLAASLDPSEVIDHEDPGGLPHAHAHRVPGLDARDTDRGLRLDTDPFSLVADHLEV
jgi:hypothetical protein